MTWNSLLIPVFFLKDSHMLLLGKAAPPKTFTKKLFDCNYVFDGKRLTCH